MGLGFLAPLFLAGLAALAIPVLVHLVHKQDATVKAFPSLMFLQRAPSPLQRRREIRHWLLLALRCLALVLMVLAFAQPFIERDSSAGAIQADRRDRVLLMDRSYSMGYGDHWTRAREAARAALDELGGGDRAALVYVDSEAEVARALGSDHETLAGIIESSKPGARPTNLNVGLRRAARLLADSTACLREIHLISDFQRSGWNPHAGTGLAEGIRLETIAVTTPDARNAAVWVSRLRPVSGESSVALEVGIAGGQETGEADQPQQLTLSTEGRVVETRNLRSQHGNRFLLPTPSRGTAKGEVRIQADGLTIDDSFRFATRAERPIRVLIVEPSRPRNHQSAFIVEALRLSESPRFSVETKKTDPLAIDDLRAATVVILNETALRSKDLDEELLRFVEAGGGLLVVAGAEAATMATLGPRQLTPSLPTTRPVPEAKGPVTITWTDASHPALAALSAPGSVDLSHPRITRYQPLELETEDTVLARFDDGGAALVERRYGKGRVLILTTTADTHWSNLPLQPVFLPLMHELTSYLAGYTPLPPWHSVGETVDLGGHFTAHPGVEAAAVRAIADIVVESPSGRQTRLPAAAALLVLDEPGWYELHAPGEESLRDLIAVNVDPGESDLMPIPVSQVLASIETLPALQPTAGTETGPPSEDSTDAPRIWWYLLLLAAMVLATETLVSNRLSKAA